MVRRWELEEVLEKMEAMERLKVQKPSRCILQKTWCKLFITVKFRKSSLSRCCREKGLWCVWEGFFYTCVASVETISWSTGKLIYNNSIYHILYRLLELGEKSNISWFWLIKSNVAICHCILNWISFGLVVRQNQLRITELPHIFSCILCQLIIKWLTE